jgi:hypothetical protein
MFGAFVDAVQALLAPVVVQKSNNRFRSLKMRAPTRQR